MIHLYKISEGNLETDLYVYSTLTDEPNIRGFYRYTDHGGCVYEDYERVATTGIVTEITALDQVPKQDWDIIPYNTDEWVEAENDYLDIDETIEGFFTLRAVEGLFNG